MTPLCTRHTNDALCIGHRPPRDFSVNRFSASRCNPTRPAAPLYPTDQPIGQAMCSSGSRLNDAPRQPPHGDDLHHSRLSPGLFTRVGRQVSPGSDVVVGTISPNRNTMLARDCDKKTHPSPPTVRPQLCTCCSWFFSESHQGRSASLGASAAKTTGVCGACAAANLSGFFSETWGNVRGLDSRSAAVVGRHQRPPMPGRQQTGQRVKPPVLPRARRRELATRFSTRGGLNLWGFA